MPKTSTGLCDRAGIESAATATSGYLGPSRFRKAGTFKTSDLEIEILHSGPVAQPDRAAVS